MTIQRTIIRCLMACVLALACGCGSTENEGSTPPTSGDSGMDVDHGMGSGSDGSTESDGMVMMGQPDLRLSSPSLALVLPPDGMEVSGEMTLRNQGTAPLSISSVRVEQSDGMTFSISPEISSPQELGVDETLVLTVTYSASAESEGHSADLIIESNDPDAPQLTAALSGRAGETCIRAMPTSLDLGGVDPGIRSGRFEVNIINCGDVPYTIGSVSIEGDMDFSWTTRNEVDPVGQVLARGNSLTLLVDYQNNRLSPDEVTTGNLRVSFSEDWAEPMDIALRSARR